MDISDQQSLINKQLNSLGFVYEIDFLSQKEDDIQQLVKCVYTLIAQQKENIIIILIYNKRSERIVTESEARSTISERYASDAETTNKRISINLEKAQFDVKAHFNRAE